MRGRDSGAAIVPLALTLFIIYPWQLEPRSPRNVRVTEAGGTV